MQHNMIDGCDTINERRVKLDAWTKASEELFSTYMYDTTKCTADFPGNVKDPFKTFF